MCTCEGACDLLRSSAIDALKPSCMAPSRTDDRCDPAVAQRLPGGRGSQNRILPVQMSLYMTQSPMKLYSGRLKLAGLFFSNTKWPTQAQP